MRAVCRNYGRIRYQQTTSTNQLPKIIATSHSVVKSWVEANTSWNKIMASKIFLNRSTVRFMFCSSDPHAFSIVADIIYIYILQAHLYLQYFRPHCQTDTYQKSEVNFNEIVCLSNLAYTKQFIIYLFNIFQTHSHSVFIWFFGCPTTSLIYPSVISTSSTRHALHLTKVTVARGKIHNKKTD